jgi:phenylacetic acid degradation operon negative regulatory protein
MDQQLTPDSEARARPRHPSSLFPEFLGLFVRPHGGWAPAAAMVTLMEQVGYDPPAVRTLISRQKSRGWLIAETRVNSRGYRLSDEALHSLDESDKIVWHAPDPVDPGAGWVLVTFSVPESDRQKRHLLRSRLAAVGFGGIGPGTLIAPAPTLRAAREVLEGYHLTEYADVFLAVLPEGTEAASLIHRAWDLEALNADYQDFIRVEQPVLAWWEQRGDCPATDAAVNAHAYRDYLFAFNRWRRLPLKDPGLPARWIGPDWSGPAAGRLFERLVELLRPRAQRHAEAYWG